MSTFRKVYHELSDAEKEHVEQIKDAAQKLEILIKQGLGKPLDTFTAEQNQQRHIALAMTNLEHAVMWAVKAYT